MQCWTTRPYALLCSQHVLDRLPAELLGIGGSLHIICYHHVTSTLPWATRCKARRTDPAHVAPPRPF
jgi:hypothetical protein